MPRAKGAVPFLMLRHRRLHDPNHLWDIIHGGRGDGHPHNPIGKERWKDQAKPQRQPAMPHQPQGRRQAPDNGQKAEAIKPDKAGCLQQGQMRREQISRRIPRKACGHIAARPFA